jgi:DNA-binding response OmpR family regulator
MGAIAIAPAPPVSEPIVAGPLEVRPDEYEVLANGVRVGLTVREFEVFLVLATSPDRVIPRPVIYQSVWHAPMPYRDRAVDVFVRKARLKLAAAAPDWTFIHTHFGIGYRFNPEPVEP